MFVSCIKAVLDSDFAVVAVIPAADFSVTVVPETKQPVGFRVSRPTSPLTLAATHAFPRGLTAPYLSPVDTIASFCTPTIAQAPTDAPRQGRRRQDFVELY